MKKQEIIGGQAVIEGVMMLNQPKMAIAVRTPNKEIALKEETLKLTKSKILKLPFIRGVTQLITMLIVGMKALNYSAVASGQEEGEEELSKWAIIGTLIFSMFLALALFKFLPLLITKWVTNAYPLMQTYNILPNFLDGLLKIGLFVLYIWAISRMKDIKRLFQYHGAEHKTIHNLESGKEVTVENSKKYSRFHRRCGTSFIMMVFIISVLVYTLIPFNSTTFLENFALRILLLPIIAGISYEVNRASAKKSDSAFFKIITAPGLWLQRLTTQEPDEEQLEVAIRSLKAVY